MKRAAIILSLLAIAPQLLPSQVSARDAVPPEVDVAPRAVSVMVRGGTVEQHARLQWSMERFEIAGLELPQLEVTIHDSSAGCSGNDGLYWPEETLNRIDICTDSTFIVLHELGHAWEHNFATDSARQHLMDELELEAWTGDAVEYRKRGTEAAANLIAWGLVDSQLTESQARTLVEKLNRFESLTGVPTLRIDG